MFTFLYYTGGLSFFTGIFGHYRMKLLRIMNMNGALSEVRVTHRLQSIRYIRRQFIYKWVTVFS